MNYYEILKIPKTASDQQIKSSYKELVKKYHPDLYVGDKDFAEHKIKEINEAYDVLSNPTKKLEYDEYLNIAATSSTIYHSVSTSNSSSDSKATSTDDSSKAQWSFSKWLTKKFSQLDKKRQLQIFIAIFILILSLFLINLIEVKYYLNHFSSSSNTVEETNTEFTQNFFDEPDLDYDNPDDFKSLDDLLYDLFESYQNNTFSDEYNEYKNTF